MISTTAVILIVALAHFPLIVLATYLINLYVTQESGPARIFERLRRWAGIDVPVLLSPIFVNDVMVDEYSVAVALGIEPVYMEIGYESDGTYLADVLSCHRCFAPYAATLAALTVVFPPLLYILAGAAASILMIERQRDASVGFGVSGEIEPEDTL